MATAAGLSKVFILDKYFTELTKYWQTEQQLQDLCKHSSNMTQNNDTNENLFSEIHDLIHLPGPLTEDALLRALQSRFFAKEYYTNVGPILLSCNPYHDVNNPMTLNSTHQEALRCPQLLQIVCESVRQQSETGYPQAIILSGVSGSGKTYSSMLLLRQLFNVAGGGPETDAFKHLAAAFTVLRSLGSAKTSSNSDSSRIGHFIEVQVTYGALYRTKIHCYFLDQSRVVRPLPNEKNYHIFYQMLAGLTHDEKVKLHLEGYSLRNLRYLNIGDINQNELEDAARFDAWKSCLSVLGIPFMDVLRVLAAILLLGNIQFPEIMVNNAESICDSKSCNNSEIKAVASLLGISNVSLYRGLTTRTHTVRGQLVKSLRDSISASQTRDSLAKALYCRTVATIVRRANSLKRIGSSCGTLSSDSNESVHNHTETGSHRASTAGSQGAKSHKSLNVLSSAVRHATDGFIGILDIFGFEDSKPSQLEQLCINLCAETMQHFYNTHIFKSSIETCKEEGVRSDIEIDYVDNVPVIDFISSFSMGLNRTGLLSMLDVECSIRGTPESYVQKIKAQHKTNSRYFDPNSLSNVSLHDAQLNRLFGIRHFAGNVVYDASNFIDGNADRLSDDVVAIFHKSSCTFGFATHLFGMEVKALYSHEIVPRGFSFRISPTAHSELQNGTVEPISTLTQDFHTRLDNLLRTLVHARPHFIRCIKVNNNGQLDQFDRRVVVQQIRSLQILETVNLMAGGLPHRMRFRAFIARYRILASFKKLRRTEDKLIEDCKLVLHSFAKILDENNSASSITTWAIGKRHIFLSEGTRQQLEVLRSEKRNSAAILIQSQWRGWCQKRRWPALKNTLLSQKSSHTVTTATKAIINAALNGNSNANINATCSAVNRPRPQPITGTPPPTSNNINPVELQHLIGIDLENPPPVPPSRPYTVTGNAKLSYPQTRVMKMDYPEDGSGEINLSKGENVLVVGASTKRGHLLVEHKNMTISVPYQYLELKINGSNGFSRVNGNVVNGVNI